MTTTKSNMYIAVICFSDRGIVYKSTATITEAMVSEATTNSTFFIHIWILFYPQKTVMVRIGKNYLYNLNEI
jgi:hypothetical protein